MTAAVAEELAHQPAAAAAIAAALASPSHAYLFTGPAGSGKRDAARRFAAELLAAGAADPASARDRALQDPSPHPDLEWLEPVGARHQVDDIRDRVVSRVNHRPYEGERRVFVIAAAESMGPESQNALLKTLEEPADAVTLILVADELAAILPTVRSRCQEVGFVAPPPEVAAAMLGAGEDGVVAVRLAGGDINRARYLLTDEGRELRAMAENLARATIADRLGEAPWAPIVEFAAAEGERASDEFVERARQAGEEFGDADTREGKRRVKDASDDAKRVARRERTRIIDLALALVCAWWRDVAVYGESNGDVEGLLLASDREELIAADAAGLDPIAARRAAELAMQARSRLRVNVTEELAFEAMCFRAAYLFGRGRQGGRG